MDYQIAICEDVIEDAQYLTSVVQSWAQEQKVSVNVETFPSAESFLFRYEEKKDFDILLLDVEMKKISGIQLAKQIRTMDHRAEIIFTTAAQKLSVELPSLVISCNGETVKLLDTDIQYIESFLHYIVIHMQSTEYKLKENLSALEKSSAVIFTGPIDPTWCH